MNTNTQPADAEAGDERHTIATYLSDMIALERHIATPIDAQLASRDHQSFSDAMRTISQIKRVTDEHISSLNVQLEAVGGDPVGGVKSAWASLLGTGAAAINNVRKTKVSKSLRDDYTALGLAAIGYTMLHATALGLGDRSTAALAKRHLDDIAPIVIEISRTIGLVVLKELADDGENVAISAAQYSEEITAQSWSGSNPGVAAAGR